MSEPRAKRDSLKRLVRLPLFPVMGVIELLAFVVALVCVVPFPNVTARIITWADTLPNPGWYVGKQSNTGGQR